MKLGGELAGGGSGRRTVEIDTKNQDRETGLPEYEPLFVKVWILSESANTQSYGERRFWSALSVTVTSCTFRPSLVVSL